MTQSDVVVDVAHKDGVATSIYSDTRPSAAAVVFSPTRQELSGSILQLNDDWLNECGGYGAVAHVLSRVDIQFVLIALFRLLGQPAI